MAKKEKIAVPKQNGKLFRREWLTGYLFLLPNFIGFLIFTGIPVIMGFYISMTNYSGYGSKDFIGITNYVKMVGDSDFRNALRNNLVYSLTSVPLTILFALLLALEEPQLGKLLGLCLDLALDVLLLPQLRHNLIKKLQPILIHPGHRLVKEQQVWHGIKSQSQQDPLQLAS